MAEPDIFDVKKLLGGLVFPFYEIKRDMDLPIKKRRSENDAEHAWSVALLACALAEQLDRTLDLGKIAQLAIVHDLVEVFAGDTSIWDEKLLENKQEREKKALAIIQKKYANFPWIGRMVAEYEDKTSAEALFIWAVDKYIATLTRWMDLEQGGRFFVEDQPKTLREFRQGIEATRLKAHAHNKIGKYYDMVLAEMTSHPEWFASA